MSVAARAGSGISRRWELSPGLSHGPKYSSHHLPPTMCLSKKQESGEEPGLECRHIGQGIQTLLLHQAPVPSWDCLSFVWHLPAPHHVPSAWQPAVSALLLEIWIWLLEILHTRDFSSCVCLISISSHSTMLSQNSFFRELYWDICYKSYIFPPSRAYIRYFTVLFYS